MYLIDADAFLCMRHVSVLKTLETATAALYMTDFIARHELASVANVIEGLEHAGRLATAGIKGRTPAHQRYRELQKAGADKGEAEAIAWASLNKPNLIFITHDVGARKHAVSHKLTCDDVFGLAIRLVESKEMTFEEAKGKFSFWDDDKNAFGKPADYTSFAETWAKRGGPAR